MTYRTAAKAAVAASFFSIAAAVSTAAMAAGAPALVSGNSALNELAGASSNSQLHLVQRRGRMGRRGGYRREGVRRSWRGGRRGYRARGYQGRGYRDYNRRYYYRGYRSGGHWIGPAIGAGIASIIIGGAIDASKHRYRSRWERCDDRYRSFRWSDGTFQPYGGGPRRLCPYLRR